MRPPGGRKVRSAASVMKCPQPCSGKRRVLAIHPAGKMQEPGAQSRHKTSKLIVPGRDISGQRLANLRVGGDGARDQEQHRCKLARGTQKSIHPKPV